jgi:hypothetical protein
MDVLELPMTIVASAGTPDLSVGVRLERGRCPGRMDAIVRAYHAHTDRPCNRARANLLKRFGGATLDQHRRAKRWTVAMASREVAAESGSGGMFSCSCTA